MFVCDQCHRVSAPGESRHPHVLETRVHAHPSRRYRPRHANVDVIDPGGSGTQIVRAIGVCPRCVPTLAPSSRAALDR